MHRCGKLDIAQNKKGFNKCGYNRRIAFLKPKALCKNLK